MPNCNSKLSMVVVRGGGAGMHDKKYVRAVLGWLSDFLANEKKIVSFKSLFGVSAPIFGVFLWVLCGEDKEKGVLVVTVVGFR